MKRDRDWLKRPVPVNLSSGQILPDGRTKDVKGGFHVKQEQTASQKKRFIVLDGSSLIYRAFYALPGFTDSHGQPTGAIFAYANMLTKLMSEHKPDLMALAFDKSRHTFRTERYADYKGGRDKTPEELLAQLPLLREFTEYMGMPF